MIRGPRVSVVTSFLNAESFLAEAVDSVLRQTCTDWELLLIDDGSTDGSTALARQFAATHPRVIRYFDHDGHSNRGSSAGRNAGAEAARGTYLAFLDADDVYLPDKLAFHTSALDTRHEVDAVFGESLRWHGWTGLPTDARRDKPRSLQITPETVYERGELLSRLLRRLSFTPTTCGLVVRRHAFWRVGGFEERFRGMHDDQAFMLKLFYHCRTFMTSGVFERYRQHPQSCCAVAIREGHYRDDGPCRTRLHLLDWFACYLRAQTQRDRTLQSIVDVERWLERHPVLGRAAHRATRRAGRTLARWRASRAHAPSGSH